MNNEVMARAVTQLDDGLIAQAHTFSKKSRFNRPVARLLAAAACVAVIFCAALAFFSFERIDVSVNGETVAGDPLAVAQSVSVFNRCVPQELSVRIAVRTDKKIIVNASDGFLSTDTENADGKTLALTSDTSFVWTVENPDIGRQYFLSIGRKTGLMLSYDESLNNWTILKTRR